MFSFGSTFSIYDVSAFLKIEHVDRFVSEVSIFDICPGCATFEIIDLCTEFFEFKFND